VHGGGPTRWASNGREQMQQNADLNLISGSAVSNGPHHTRAFDGLVTAARLRRAGSAQNFSPIISHIYFFGLVAEDRRTWNAGAVDFLIGVAACWFNKNRFLRVKCPLLLTAPLPSIQGNHLPIDEP
jgi:hypothetical protein